MTDESDDYKRGWYDGHSFSSGREHQYRADLEYQCQRLGIETKGLTRKFRARPLPEKIDRTEIAIAVQLALLDNGIPVHPGDGLSIVMQMIGALIDEREAAQRTIWDLTGGD